jgi:hypothetical protein
MNPVPVLPTKVYDFLKWLAQIVLPALATLYLALGLPHSKEVSGAIIAVDAFLGAILNLSSKAYNESDDRFAGDAVVTGSGENKKVSFAFNEHPSDLVSGKKELVFKVKRDAPVKKASKRTAKKAVSPETRN